MNALLLNQIASEFGLAIYQEDSFDLAHIREVFLIPEEAAVRVLERDSGLISFEEFRQVVVHAAPELLGKLWLMASKDVDVNLVPVAPGPAFDFKGLITEVATAVAKGMAVPDHALKAEGYTPPPKRTDPELLAWAIHEYRAVEGAGVTYYPDHGMVLIDWRAVNGKKSGPFKGQFPELVTQPDWRGWRDFMDTRFADYRVHLEKYEFFENEEDEDPIEVDHERPERAPDQSLEDWQYQRPHRWILTHQKEEELVELLDQLLPTLNIKHANLKRFSVYVLPQEATRCLS